MRQGQNGKRSRGRGRRQQNPSNRSYESNGPDVKIRGNANTIVEKYQTLARDAQSSGDRVMAENYLQHAEHYQRIINSFAPPERPERDNDARDNDARDNDARDTDARDGDAKADDQTGQRAKDSGTADKDDDGPDAIKVSDTDAPQPDIPDDAHAATSAANGNGEDKPKRRTRRARKPAAEVEAADDSAPAESGSEETAEAQAG